MSVAVCDFVVLHRAALCAAYVALSAAVSSSAGGIWGVSDPSATPPVPVPRLSPRGSLTPQMRVTVVRQNRALSLTSLSAPPVSRSRPRRSVWASRPLTGFAGKQRPYG